MESMAAKINGRKPRISGPASCNSPSEERSTNGIAALRSAVITSPKTVLLIYTPEER